jgi:hypothetical protein
LPPPAALGIVVSDIFKSDDSDSIDNGKQVGRMIKYEKGKERKGKERKGSGA